MQAFPVDCAPHILFTARAFARSNRRAAHALRELLWWATGHPTLARAAWAHARQGPCVQGEEPSARVRFGASRCVAGARAPSLSRKPGTVRTAETSARLMELAARKRG